MPKEACGNRMKIIRSALVALPVLVGMAALAPAKAHDWYPNDCCHDKDCAPVESMVRLCRRVEASRRSWSRRSTARRAFRRDFSLRESKDSRMHVCMGRHDTGDMDVICLFMPPGRVGPSVAGI